MTVLDVFHIGIVVPDIEVAAHELTAGLGLEFVEPMIARAAAFDDRGSTRELALRISYSRQGPPYIELLESQGIEGLYGSQEIGLHHVGLWAADPGSVLKHLSGAGIKIEAAQYEADSSIIALYTEPSAMAGTRFEYVNRSLQPNIDLWLKTAPALTTESTVDPPDNPPGGS
jgi:catechol 2,3-dioxygenase-like lactoylglutathione lyase family enzyme